MINPAKKRMLKDMALGAVALTVVLMIPKIGEKVSDIIGSVRTKIGG